MAAPAPIPVSADPFASKPLPLSRIFGRTLETGKIERPHLRFLPDLRKSQGFALKASMGSPGFTQQRNKGKLETLSEAEDGCDIFNNLKDRFLSFKNKYMENIEQFEKLADAQAPKFMVIACADSRVCPSNILGFQPGEAFVIRNVANLVPTFESGPSETNAALEFAVNSLQVENILVIGHSCCGGIRALMGMQDDGNASFIKNWVVVGKNARIKTEAAASDLSFDAKCRHCEKWEIGVFGGLPNWRHMLIPILGSKALKEQNQESINHSLLNLLTYPWIEEKVVNGELSVHGGYYDFIECSFEKWTLDYRGTKLEENGRIAAKDKVLWC